MSILITTKEAQKMLISNGCSCSTSFPKRVPGLRARDDWQVGLVNLPNKILHVLSRALPADNRSKARVCVRHGAEYLLRLQYTSLSNFMTGDFDTWWMNACPSLSNVTLQEPPGFLSPNLRCEYASVYWCEICRTNTIFLENFAILESCPCWTNFLGRIAR